MCSKILINIDFVYVYLQEIISNETICFLVIRFNLYKGDQGFTNHIKLYNFSDLIYEGNIGGLLWNTIHLKFYGTAIFLEVSAPSEEPNGITNNWIDISEIEFYGYD
ncbi:MAG: hypothetical protein GY936_03850 [Ignavibacteriae bacterium]|nr:hypothetical protein [Ignavibacteriota bacterium]